MSKHGEDQPTVLCPRTRVQERPQLWLAFLAFALLTTSLAIHLLLPLATNTGLASPLGLALLLVAALEATLLWYSTWMLLAWLSTFTRQTSKIGSALRTLIDLAAPEGARKLAARALVSTSLAGAAAVGLTGVAVAEPADPLLFPSNENEIAQEDADTEEIWWPDDSPLVPAVPEADLPEPPQAPSDRADNVVPTPIPEVPEPPAKAPTESATSTKTQAPAKAPARAQAKTPARAAAPVERSDSAVSASSVRELTPLTASQQARQRLRGSESTPKSEDGAEVAALQGLTHTVLPGDCLWNIAGEMLGRGASSQEIADLWPVIYSLNKDVIGKDPNLIEPGQVLLLPDMSESEGLSLEDGRAA